MVMKPMVALFGALLIAACGARSVCRQIPGGQRRPSSR